MVFFDWDRSNLSEQALNTIRQAAGAYKTKGNARITATGHTDTSGPEAYNMALSLRRANTVKDALVREGVPATAIAVIGRGESQPAGADRGRRARAAEPPRRDRHPVSHDDPNREKAAERPPFLRLAPTRRPSRAARDRARTGSRRRPAARRSNRPCSASGIIACVTSARMAPPPRPGRARLPPIPNC